MKKVLLVKYGEIAMRGKNRYLVENRLITTIINRLKDYEGKWFTPLCDSLRAYIKASQEYVTGTANLKLYKGNIIKQGTTSPYSLYNESIASFATGDMYDHHDAEGFINLFGLSLKVRAMKLAEAEKKK